MRLANHFGLAVVLIAAPASAAVWSYRCPVPTTCPSSNGAGNLTDAELRFNTSHLDFTWNAVWSPNEAGNLPSGCWLVIGKGPEPENTTDQFAILYGDVATGRVSAYVYDKNSGEDSWDTPGTLIESIPGALSSFMNGPDLHWQLMVNVANINGFAGPDDWVGLYFEDEIGFWIAGLNDFQVAFDPQGRIDSLSWDGRTSWDRHDRTTAPPLAVESASWGQAKARYRE